jgi:hypothetical protein
MQHRVSNKLLTQFVANTMLKNCQSHRIMIYMNNFVDEFRLSLQNNFMQQKSHPRQLEKVILSEIADLDRKRNELEKERYHLERMLLRVRKENLSNVDVTRKNSLGRVLIENAITEYIKSAKGKNVASNQLFAAVRLKDPRIKESTFRSHLHRMKAKGTILRANTISSCWLLPETDSADKEE